MNAAKDGIRKEVPLGGKFEYIEVPKGGDIEKYSNEMTSRFKFFRDNKRKTYDKIEEFYDKDKNLLPKFEEILYPDDGVNFMYKFDNVTVTDTEPLFYRIFTFDPLETNKRIKFFSDPNHSNYVYYDKDNNFLGKFGKDREKSVFRYFSNNEYPFTHLVSDENIALGNKDTIYYEEPKNGGRRNRRTYRRRNKTRRNKSRRRRS
jgi:hypothetical protein